jgi:hypothetical protein
MHREKAPGNSLLQSQKNVLVNSVKLEKLQAERCSPWPYYLVVLAVERCKVILAISSRFCNKNGCAILQLVLLPNDDQCIGIHVKSLGIFNFPDSSSAGGASLRDYLQKVGEKREENHNYFSKAGD